MLKDKMILYAGNSPWGETSEQHIMMEQLSADNRVIWVNPYGSLSGAIMPRITTSKEGLTIYNPGINYLSLPSLSRFNELRRLMQVKMYLFEKNFLPDLIWFDDPIVQPFIDYYRKQGALALYYAEGSLALNAFERGKLATSIDMIFITNPQVHKKYLSYENVYFLEGGDLLPPPEGVSDQQIDYDLLENKYMEALNKRLEEICGIIKSKLDHQHGV